MSNEYLRLPFPQSNSKMSRVYMLLCWCTYRFPIILLHPSGQWPLTPIIVRSIQPSDCEKSWMGDQNRSDREYGVVAPLHDVIWKVGTWSTPVVSGRKWKIEDIRLSFFKGVVQIFWIVIDIFAVHIWPTLTCSIRFWWERKKDLSAIVSSLFSIFTPSASANVAFRIVQVRIVSRTINMQWSPFNLLWNRVRLDEIPVSCICIAYTNWN